MKASSSAALTAHASRSLEQDVRTASPEFLRDSILRLLGYCRAQNWEGHDPYDALNSRVFLRLPFSRSKIARILLTQALKRLPVNLRTILKVPRTQNPKGLALFGSASLKLSSLGLLPDPGVEKYLLTRLIDSRSPSHSYCCWGYDFDWQTRTLFVPRNEPNVIVTTFAGSTLLDYFERYGDPSCLELAFSAGRFLSEKLFSRENDDEGCFSYTALQRDNVHNANLLAAAFLARLHKEAGEREFIENARAAVRYTVARQRKDGSWPYGEAPTQQWIDGFHTGYNLVALKDFCEFDGQLDCSNAILTGFDFYRDRFFSKRGEAWYYSHRKYPIDIHSISQGIITFARFGENDASNLDFSYLLCRWAIDHLQSRGGFFYFRKYRFLTNRIPYIRWSQAWMLYALAVLATAHAKIDIQGIRWGPGLTRYE